ASQLVAADAGPGNLSQWMPNKLRPHPPVTPEIHFKGEDGKSLAHILADDTGPPRPPGPELRRYVVEHRNTTAMQGTSHTKVESGGIYDHAHVRPALGDGTPQTPQTRVNPWQVAQNLGDSHHGNVLRVHHRVAAGRPHALSPEAENLYVWAATAQSFNQLRAVHVSGGLSSGDEDARGVIGRGWPGIRRDGRRLLVVSCWQKLFPRLAQDNKLHNQWVI